LIYQSFGIIVKSTCTSNLMKMHKNVLYLKLVNSKQY